jgi:hypothetical protein
MFAVNICVATAGHDRYDKVAINKYPIVITSGELTEVLASNSIKTLISTVIKTRDVYNSAEFYVMAIDNDKLVYKKEIPVRDLIALEFAEENQNS